MSKMSKAIAALGVVAGLGVAALPLSSYAADGSVDAKATADVQVQVGGAISITVDNGLTGEGVAKNLVDLGQIKLNGDIVAKPLKVTISTNNAVEGTGLGYNLTMNTVSTNNALINENGAELKAGIPTKGTSAWGWAKGTGMNDTSLTGWAVVPAAGAAGAAVNNAGSISAGNTSQDNFVYFGATASGTQAEGTYRGSVVFTATVNE